MTSFSELLDCIEDASKSLSIAVPHLGKSKSIGKAYEVWIALELSLELTKRGHAVIAVDHTGKATRELRVRGAPGDMPSVKSKTGKEPGFLAVQSRRKCEIHLGLQHGSRMWGTHELDISILPAAHRSECRENGGGSFDLCAPILALELKAYDKGNKLSHLYPRALVGVMTHLDPLWPVNYVLIANAPGRWSRAFRPTTARAIAGLVTTTVLYDNSKRALESVGALAFETVEPSSYNDAIEELVKKVVEIVA